MSSLWRLLQLFRPYTGWLMLGILVSSLTLFANVALMAISGWFISAMALAGAAGVSMNYFSPAAMIRAAAIVRTGGRYLERLVTHEATFRLLASLRLWFYNQLEPLAPTVIEDYRSGDLLSRIRADIDSLDNFYIRVLIPLVVALFAALLLVWIMSLYDSGLAQVLLLMLLVAGLLLPLLMIWLARQPGEQLVQQASALRTTVIDGVQGLAELAVCGAAETSAKQLEADGEALAMAQKSMARIRGLSQSGLLLISNLAVWLVVLLAVPLVSTGGIELAELAMLALFTMAAFESVLPLPEAFRLLGEVRSAAARLFEIADRQSEIREPEVAAPQPADFYLRFTAVHFQYATETTPVLQGIELDLPPGNKLAVVGPTGSGKSSLIQLLLRNRTPQSGEILLGDQPLSAYRSEDLRNWIAVVPQQVYLFNASIRDNLKLADPQADDARLEQVCRVVQIWDFIAAQPQQLDSWVGETGVRLSGGQARRLAIARALLRDFHLLVLDEPGEGLDAATLQLMMRAIQHYLGQRSLLLISHQLAGLQQVDEIMVLENGMVLEHGAYADLIRRQGRFSELMSCLASEPGSEPL